MIIVQVHRAVARALIEGGGRIFIYCVMPDEFLLKSVVFKLISKEISRAEHDYMNTPHRHPPPPPNYYGPARTLSERTSKQTSEHCNEYSEFTNKHSKSDLQSKLKLRVTTKQNNNFYFFFLSAILEWFYLYSLGLVQTSNFSCAELNANELKQRT